MTAMQGRKRVGARWCLPGFLLALAVLAGCGAPEPPSDSGVNVAEALGQAEAEGFARATDPRRFRFPADHGPHPAFRNEWWYLTGNLEGTGGRRFGFQVTFFRIGLSAEPVESPSAWAANAVWMAHFALTDAHGKRFHAFERFARDAVGLAGAQAEPLAVWLEEWRLTGTEDGLPWRLEMAEEGIGLNLSLEPQKPPVLQGDAGLSQKSAEPGNASYYYSIPRLAARGTVTSNGETIPVTGLAWLDREWSTSALGPDQVGWDWFALQFDDGSDLMLYRLRRRDGATDPHSAGSFITPEGGKRALAAGDFELEPVEMWESPRGGRYPVAWRLRLPALGLELVIRPLLRDQELELTVRYWEGAVDVHGTRGGRPVQGRGYVELTGYAE